MDTTRRKLGALLLGGAALGGAARAAQAAARDYPALGALAALLRDRQACARLTDAGLGVAMTRERLAAVESRVALALKQGGGSPQKILFALNAADFRAGRSVKVGGYALAETEAGAIVLRSASRGQS